MQKSLYLLALFGLLSLELQGCGGGDEEEEEEEEEEDDPVIVTSYLTLTGVTVEQAEMMSDAIIAGIAETLDGISVDDIELGTFARRLSGRQLGSHSGVTVQFTVIVPEGMTPTALSDAVSEAAADPTALLAAIVEAVKADADLLAALEEAGVDIDAVTITVSEPEIVGEGYYYYYETTTDAPVTDAPVTDAPVTDAPTEKPTEAPVNGTNSSRRLEFAFTTNELIA